MSADLAPAALTPTCSCSRQIRRPTDDRPHRATATSSPTAGTCSDTAERHACWCYRPGSCAKCGRPEGEHHNNQRHLIRDLQAVVAEWDQRGATWCMKRIAALLAGGGE